MDHLPSPTTAERNQKRKLQYLPPVWPLLLIVALIVGIAVAVSR
jgi:hypothetical protein